MSAVTIFDRRSLLKHAAVLLALFCFSVTASQTWARDRIPFGINKIIFEFNSTGQDLGVQVSLDGEPWNEVKIVNPKGRTIFEVEGKGSLKNFGLTELFFETHEPSILEVPVAEIFARFPEGEYKFTGKTVDGDILVGSATLNHRIPAGPVIVSPAPGGAVDPNNAVISWTPGNSAAGIKIGAYQVIVDGGSPARRLDVVLPATVSSMKVPPEFLEAGKPYKFEVLAIEVGGNQSITEGEFSTN